MLCHTVDPGSSKTNGEKGEGEEILPACAWKRGEGKTLPLRTQGGGEKEGKRAVFFGVGFCSLPSSPSPPVSGGGVCEVESRAETKMERLADILALKSPWFICTL